MHKQPDEDEQLIDAVMWLLEKHQPWLIVVHARSGSPDEAARPMQLNKARGFVAMENFERGDATVDFITAVVDKKQSGGRLAVVVGQADLRGRLAELLTTGACKLIGGRRTRDGAHYVVTSEMSLREHLGVIAQEAVQ